MKITRRAATSGLVAAVVTASLPAVAGLPSGFIAITNDGKYITSPMPPDETVVEVLLDDGSVTRAWYAQNIMDAGDYDFVPAGVEDEPEENAESISDRVVAWRMTG